MSNDYLSRHLASREDNAQEKTYRFQDEDVSFLMVNAFSLSLSLFLIRSQ